jgi:transcription elongation factor Elf1
VNDDYLNDDLSACPECGSEDVDLDATQHSKFIVCNDCGNEY